MLGVWEQQQLKTVTNIVNRTDENSSAPIMMITASNGFIDQSERYAYDNTGASLKKYIILHKGELAYNHGASKLRPYGSCFALDVDNARVPFVYHCFSTSSCDPYFLSTILNSCVVEHQLRRLISSGARMDGLLNISYSDYSNIYITLPTLDEQKKITQLLRTLDGLINLHQRQTEKLKKLKQGLLQAMFPREGESVPRLRFPGFTTTWKQQKLGDIYNFHYGEFNNNPDNNGPYPVYGANGIIGGYTKFNAEDSSIIGHIGAAGYVKWGMGKHFVTYNGTIAKPAVSSLDSKFGYYALSNKKIYKICAGSGRPFVSYADLNSIDMRIPNDLLEQKKISLLLTRLDDLLTLHERYVTTLIHLKKGLLQKMFPQD